MIVMALIFMMIAFAGVLSLIIGIVLLMFSFKKRKEKKFSFLLSIILCGTGLLICFLIAAMILKLQNG